MIPNHRGEIPVVLLLLPFLLGIICGLNFFAAVNVVWLIAVFAFLAAVFIILNLTYNRFRLYKQRWLGGVFMNVLLFLFGLIIVNNYSELKSTRHFSKTPAQYLVVKINTEPVLKNGFYRFIANVEENIQNNKRSTTDGTLLISIKDSSAKKLYYGDELLIPATYNAVDPPFNPAEFNYKQYLANKNIFYQAFLYPGQFVLLKSNAGNPVKAFSLRLRQRLVEKLKRNMRDTDAVAVASTLVLGYRADLSADVLEAYSKTGTVYVLTISGAQVAAIYFLLAFALGFLNRFKYGELLRTIIIVAVIWYYALLTGCSLAVCRVALMVSLVVVGKTFSRYINTLNILAISAFLLLCFDPFYITEAGFQLSYLAVSGLLLFQPVVYKWIIFKNKWVDKLWSLCSASIAIQSVIFPLSAFYFHQFPVYFLVSNLFVVIPAALIMYGGIFLLLLPQLPVVSRSIAFMVEKTIQATDKGLSIIEHSPYSGISKIWLSAPEYLLLYVIICSLFYFLYHKKLWSLKLSLACMLLVAASFSIKSISQSQSKSITWLNLKKHTGIVFKNGDEAIVLSDLKNTDKAYQYSIQPYLDSCGISNTALYDINQDVNSAWLKKRYGLIQFINTRIFVYNTPLQNHIFSQKLNANYIYLSGNPGVDLDEINSNFDYNTMVIDGSNSDKTVLDLQKQLSIKNIRYKILKRNNSFISISN
jgi:competence protein ComEC